MRRPLIVLAATLAACTAAPPPPAGIQFDGSYAGVDDLIRGAPFQCGEPRLPGKIDIASGRFAYPFQVNPPRTAPLPVQVAIDGSVYGQMQYGMIEDDPFRSRERFDWVTLSGRIAGPTLDATISNLRCTRRLTVARQGP